MACDLREVVLVAPKAFNSRTLTLLTEERGGSTEPRLDLSIKGSPCLTYPMSMAFAVYVTVVIQNRDAYTLVVSADLERQDKSMQMKPRWLWTAYGLPPSLPLWSSTRLVYLAQHVRLLPRYLQK